MSIPERGEFPTDWFNDAHDALEPELRADDGTEGQGEPEAGQLGIREVKCGAAHWPLRWAKGYRCHCGAAV